MNLQEALRRVVDGGDLARADMRAAMHAIMTGQATPAQIGGLLVALRLKGETVDEITAAAEVMRELATPLPIREELRPRLVDTCGTGGDSAGIFNVSTASSFVVAAAGGLVAKHGNRSVSSKSGSADVLEAAGVRLDLSPQGVAQCIETVGVGFMFAPAFHGAMKHAIGPRREMGVRTVFNLLGPLTNPAGAPQQVIGVFDRHWLVPLAEVLRALGSRHALVVHSEDGLDEISIAASTQYAELRDGQIHSGRIDPEALGLKRTVLDSLRVDDAQQSLRLIREALDNQPGAARDIVTLNAGAAIYVVGVSPSLAAGVERAQRVIASGAAAERLAHLAAYTQSL